MEEFMIVCGLSDDGCSLTVTSNGITEKIIPIDPSDFSKVVGWPGDYVVIKNGYIINKETNARVKIVSDAY